MKRKLMVLMSLAATAVASFGAVPVFYDDFETNMYVQGQTLDIPTNGWQASGTAAYVTNSGGYTNSRAVIMEAGVALTNSLSADSTLKVWTDFRIKPTLGQELWNPPTNTSTVPTNIIFGL